MQLSLSDNGVTSPFRWSSRRGSFAAFGDFGGGTAALQTSLDNGTTWFNVDQASETYVTLTANGEGGFELPPCLLRVSLSGATAPSLTFKVN